MPTDTRYPRRPNLRFLYVDGPTVAPSPADVAEFVPISCWLDTYQGDTAVEDGAADEIAADAQERAEN
ncbi:MAG: hypothetical protein ACLUW6_11035 [Coriobacteriaceae bacterium]